MSVSREINFGLTHGASLGEVLKSTYDDVYLATCHVSNRKSTRQ